MGRKLEILAPAGDVEMLRAAVFSGADSVYLGVRGFNARRAAANFDEDGLAAAVAFCHARNCGVYAALNTLALPGQEEGLAGAVRAVARAGCNAVIVQDLAAARVVRQLAPGLALHASTQMSVHSLAGVRQLAALGFSRVILARELSETEIAAIVKESPIELEVFVHGALCVGLSGQCYLSAFLGGRSANRGACAGPCRLPFRTRSAEVGFCEAKTAEPDAQSASHHLSLKDLSLLDALPRLAEMGVASSKIEGRLRGPEYCAVVVDAALKARDGLPWDGQLVRDVFSRSGFTAAWYRGENTADIFGARTAQDTGAAKKAQPKARDLYRRERPRVPVEMTLSLGPTGAALVAGDGTRTVCVRQDAALPPAGADAAPAVEPVQNLDHGVILHRNACLSTLAPRGASLPPSVAFTCSPVGNHQGFLPPPPCNTRISAQSSIRSENLNRLLEAALGKTGGTPFYLAAPPRVDAQGYFFSAGQAGALRRQALERLLALRETEPEGQELEMAALVRYPEGRGAESPPGEPPFLRARFAALEQMPANAPEQCHTLLLPLWQAEQVPQALRGKTLLWLPRALFGALEAEAARRVAQAAQWGFAGFEAQNIAHLWMLKGQAVSAGFGLNLANAMAVEALAALGARTVTLSMELSLAQMEKLAAGVRAAGGPDTDALCYGHLPLVLTRACPLKQRPGGADCSRCSRRGHLVDRKGEEFTVLCEYGMRSMHNPLPLWFADRLARLPTTFATLYFTFEDKARAGQVVADFAAGRPAGGRFTRGLYTNGVDIK